MHRYRERTGRPCRRSVPLRSVSCRASSQEARDIFRADTARWQSKEEATLLRQVKPVMKYASTNPILIENGGWSAYAPSDNLQLHHWRSIEMAKPPVRIERIDAWVLGGQHHKPKT